MSTTTSYHDQIGDRIDKCFQALTEEFHQYLEQAIKHCRVTYAEISDDWAKKHQEGVRKDTHRLNVAWHAYEDGRDADAEFALVLAEAGIRQLTLMREAHVEEMAV